MKKIVFKEAKFAAALLLGLGLFSLALFAGGVSVYASKVGHVTVAAEQQRKDPTLILTQGMAEIVEIKGSVSDVMIADPDIVFVDALQSNRLYIVGRALGTTNVLALDEGGNVLERLNVIVKIDEVPVRNLVRELFPDESVDVRVLTDKVVLTGQVSTPERAGQITNLVYQYISELTGDRRAPDDVLVNLIDVRGKRQVMLKVRIMEIQRKALRELRLDGGSIDNMIGFLGDSSHRAELAFQGAGLAGDSFGRVSLLAAGGSVGPINLIFEALEQDGLLQILAEPNLTAVSGNQAGFLAGSRIRVPSGITESGALTFAEEDVGVNLDFLPLVMSEDRINLQINTEVSAVNNAEVFNYGGISIPAIDSRRATTTIELGSGSTLMIAGLLKSETVRNLSGLPGILNVPIIGHLLSSRSFDRNETELVVLVTPYLVEPFADFEKATLIREPHHHSLSVAFGENLRRTYRNKDVPALLNVEKPYGYIID